MKRTLLTTVVVGSALAFGPAAWAQDGTAEKPNILVIFGDDIGQTNLSTYSFGLMGYTTPNIDRIANEGAKFTDYYAEQSCTAGRSTFLTGQSTLRTGLSKVGLPGANAGLQAKDATLASALKDLGYATGQFGKNHMGDRDEFLPTAHGFDEFFGNLYHLNAEEEPEQFNYPKDPEFRERFGPRGVLHSYADGEIEDTGPLTRKRMETVDEETAAGAIDFMKRAVESGTPFFTWYNTTRMHYKTHVRAENRSEPGLTAPTEYADGMVENDGVVGSVLDALDELGVADNTIVVYTTDNGPHQNTWPDAGTTPFRSEKNTNWEGAYRVPALIRWPGVIEPGTVYTDIFSGLDWFPTLMAAVGDTDIKERLLAGTTIDGKEYKNYLDGYNQLDYLTGKTEEGARDEFFYLNDDGEIVGLRYENWKVVFKEQRMKGTMAVWAEPFTELRVPKMFDLRADPYERADITSNTYWDWLSDHAYLVAPASMEIAKFFETFKEFPPSQRPDSFSIDQIQEELNNSLSSLGSQ
ncbi:arylsulfatase [Salipiger mangrovisoli]|uniref:Arylsulfatase n=1 Tax=Salipiger mangrovisoli TaxID=2865933 RepID=A0ABR9WW62_9RHOB|nr:arylsulfatase [Salipiger mangrovisoli]MBE9635475.1 arylsulfatase [Salipiger mangrovisoli]